MGGHVDPVKIGLVGYGFGGRYFHAPLLAAAPECELLGVVTTSAERRDLVSAEHPGVAVLDSLAALAGAGAEAVSISTPAETHSALTDEAIGLGLSVVCDKPFSMDPAAARRSVTLAVTRGVTLSPYQNRRWDSDFLTVRGLVDDGTLGEVRRFESRFERYAPQNGPGRSGGGTLLDFGAHLVDQALTLLGPVESVYAESRPRDNGLDDDVFVALRHENGALSHLWGSWSQYAAGPRFRVTCTAASLVVTTADTQEDVLITGARPSAGEPWGVEQHSDLDRVFTEDGSRPVSLVNGAWDTYYPTFARAVRGEGPPPVEATDAVATADVLEAARVSVERRATVRPEVDR
jgi:predicted dehydrogenase